MKIRAFSFTGALENAAPGLMYKIVYAQVVGFFFPEAPMQRT